MPIVKVGARLLYNYLVKGGVQVYEYRRRPLHGKVALMDDHWATVGSSNLDPLSLSLNLEANLIIHDRTFNQTLRDNLQGIIVNDCKQVDESMLPKRTWWNLTKSVLAFHFYVISRRWSAGYLRIPASGAGSPACPAGNGNPGSR